MDTKECITTIVSVVSILISVLSMENCAYKEDLLSHDKPCQRPAATERKGVSAESQGGFTLGNGIKYSM